MELKAVLFDLDGTLVDTAPDMVGALNRVLANHSRDEVSFTQARKIVSNGGRALIKFGFPEETNEELVDALVSEFLKSYAEHVCYRSTLYPGLHELLDFCETNGLEWGVITNKPIELAKGVLEGLGLLERCKILLGGDSLPVKKPDPVPMLHASMLLNIAPSHCLYIGDHLRDIEAGKNAGMDTAAALWGYIEDDDDPDSWGATYMVRRSEALISLVKDLLK